MSSNPMFFRLVTGQVIHSNGGIAYRLQERLRLGPGRFGERFQCVRTDAGQLDQSIPHKVAVVKVPKNRVDCYREAIVMQHLAEPNNPFDPRDGDGRSVEERHHIVKLLGQFQEGGVYGLVMESMPLDLLTLLHSQPDLMFPLLVVSSVVRQLLIALDWLKEKQFVHTKVTTENVLAALTLNGIRVKLSDFGSTIYLSGERDVAQEIQREEFSAPEIYLGAPFNESIDIWSLGIMAGQLTFGLGCELFPPTCPFNPIQVWSNVFGGIPNKVLEAGVFTRKYFIQSAGGAYDLKVEPGMDFITHVHFVLNDPTTTNSEFRDFLLQSLHVDPEKRLTPKEGLRMAFVKRSLISNAS